MYLLAVLVHLGWVLQVPAPTDIDPSYYALVARHIAAGEGAVTTAAWQLLEVPEGLPAPADLYWMPLPSRVLVPFVWLWPSWGAQIATALIGALWAPLAFALAQQLGGERWTRVGAAALATWAPGFLRRMDTPDSIALYGAVAGAAFLAASRERWKAATLLVILAALTRNDGLLLAPCIALSFSGWRLLVVALSGPLASALWTARSAGLAGPNYLEARSTIGQLADKAGLLGAEPETMALSERAVFLATDGVGVLLVIWLVALPLPGVLAFFALRKHRVMRAGLAYAYAMPVFAVMAAPAVATYGSLYRSSSALVPLAAAASALGLAALGRWAHERFTLEPAIAPLIVAGTWTAVISLAVPLAPPPPTPLGEAECALLAETSGVVFSADPLFAAERCGVQSVLHSGHQRPDQRAALAEHFDIEWALAPREDDTRSFIVQGPDEGWTEVHPRLWRRQPTQ